MVRTLVALLLLSSSAWADASLSAPVPPQTAIAAAQKLWSAIVKRDRARVAAAVGPRVNMWASLARLAVDDDYRTNLPRARFVDAALAFELGDEPATDWRRVEPPPSAPAGLAWVGASVQSSKVREGQHARLGNLTFGVALVEGRAKVVAVDIQYGESHFTAKH